MAPISSSFTYGLLLVFALVLLPSRTIGWKLLSTAKVTGQGHSTQAASLSQCISFCRKNPTCDAINYHTSLKKGKCRLFNRCAATKIVEANSDFYFYSLRPQVLKDGYMFDNGSQSCFKIIHTQMPYAEADARCQEENGRLAALADEPRNELATELLKESRAQYAWIGLRDDGKEGDPTHSDGSSAISRGYFRPAPQFWRNDTTRNCWALQDNGEWVEQSCKSSQFYSICEIPIF